MLKITDCIGCTLLILAMMRSTRGRQSVYVSFLEIRGMPKYLIGNIPREKPKILCTSSPSLSFPIVTKILFLEILGVRPDSEEKLANAL